MRSVCILLSISENGFINVKNSLLYQNHESNFEMGLAIT